MSKFIIGQTYEHTKKEYTITDRTEKTAMVSINGMKPIRKVITTDGNGNEQIEVQKGVRTITAHKEETTEENELIEKHNRLGEIIDYLNEKARITYKAEDMTEWHEINAKLRKVVKEYRAISELIKPNNNEITFHDLDNETETQSIHMIDIINLEITEELAKVRINEYMNENDKNYQNEVKNVMEYMKEELYKELKNAKEFDIFELDKGNYIAKINSK